MKLVMMICWLVMAACLCGCAGGQKDGAAKTGSGKIVGGYTDSRSLTDEEKALFESLASEVAGVKYKPVNVATQVVAGTNYRFLCTGREKGRKGKRFDAVIVIYKPLPGQGDARVTSIERQKR